MSGLGALINHPIANLFNGVSQQSPSIRQASQCELQENGWSSIVEGVHKRHPSIYVAKLMSGQAGDAYVHLINRDAVEKYAVVIRNGSIRVWDLNTGTEKTVAAPNGLGYLASSTPSSDFSAVTIADYTIILNKTITTAMGAASGSVSVTEVQTFSKLPATGTSGIVYKITGDATNSFGTYYVQWNGASYVECTAPALKNSLDASTMPYQLVRQADGSFTFGQVTWKPRLVGDLDSAAPPSYIGSKLSDITFYRNRLGFLSGENVVFSRSGDFFAFFPETVTQVLDTDPIDVAVSHTKVSILNHAIPFSRNLLLFSEQTQFVLSANDTLTPKTVTMHQTTEFECSTKAKPVACGSNIYFPVDRNGYTGFREYYVATYQLTFDADDVTAHVPRYVPGNVFKVTGSTNEDVIFALSRDVRNAIYVYKFYWSGTEKAQSSWSRWTIDSGASILSAELINTRLYLIVQRADGVYLEYIDIQTGLKETDLPILINLDRKVKVLGVYSSATNKTTWTVPYDDASAKFAYSGGFTTKAGGAVPATKTGTYTWEAAGDQTASFVYAGIPYTFRYRFSPQYMKDQNKVSMAEAKLKLRHMRVFFTNSGYFRVEVTPKGRDTSSHLWTGKQLGVGSMVLGQVQIDSGVFKFPVLSDSTTVQIDLVNDSYLPSFFQSAEWEGFVTGHSTRM